MYINIICLLKYMLNNEYYTDIHSLFHQNIFDIWPKRFSSTVIEETNIREKNVL